MTYQQKMRIFGNPLPNLRGFEYYSGGVFDLTNPTKMESALIQTQTCNVIESFDWRNRHGQNWMTPVRDQGSYRTCSVFAATGATEAFVNLYYNQHLDLDLAEQKPLKCIDGSAPFTLSYYVNTGAVLESCAPYDPDNSQVCADVCPNPTERIKMGGRIYLRDVVYPFTEEGFKKMLIKYGPLSSGIFSMGHEMTMSGFYTRSSDGATVWIFKNSWGIHNDLGGYVEIVTDLSDIRAGYALLPPITSLIYNEGNRMCTDNDGDGYYNWGIGAKPSICPLCSNEEDGDDSNSNLGPINDYGYCSHLVRTNETWQYIKNENANVIVKNGGNLTISGATINLGCDSSFSVELGGTLTFNSGTIQ